MTFNIKRLPGMVQYERGLRSLTPENPTIKDRQLAARTLVMDILDHSRRTT